MPRLLREIIASLILAALLKASGVRPAAARRLAQGAAPDSAAAPVSNGPPGTTPLPVQALDLTPVPESKYGGLRIDDCITLTNNAGQACSVESDTMSLVYPRGSEQLPTQQENDTAISNMKAAAQPSSACCKDLLPYVQSRCPCDPEYQQILPVGGFSPAYFEGATFILATACRQDFPPCRPGEISDPRVPAGKP